MSGHLRGRALAAVAAGEAVIRRLEYDIDDKTQTGIFLMLFFTPAFFFLMFYLLGCKLTQVVPQ